MIDGGIAGRFSSRVASQYADIISLCTQTKKEFRPAVSEIVEALTTLIHKQNREASSSVADKTDPFSKSFTSTHTRFISSPTFSYFSKLTIFCISSLYTFFIVKKSIALSL